MGHAIHATMGVTSQTLNQQAATTNNLADASTPGFRAQLSTLRAVSVEGLSLPTRTLITTSAPSAGMTPGKMDYTLYPLDATLQQDGWLAVQTAGDGGEYTRSDSIQVDPAGQLTIQGHPVIDETGPIAVPEGTGITTVANGTILALNPGDPANMVVLVEHLRLMKATDSEIQRGDDGIFRLSTEAQATHRSILQTNPASCAISGILEGSDINAVATMNGTIANTWRFGIQMGVISSVDDNAGRANQLLSMS